MKDFVVIILTHGRPNNVKTIKTLKKCGYTGEIIIAVDDTDETLEEYISNYKGMVEVFNKKKIGKTFDRGGNWEPQKVITYARNASFEIAKKRGYEYFMQLDDDYTSFQWRFKNEEYLNATPSIKSLDEVFNTMLEFYKSVPWCKSLAMAQGGDFIGGKNATSAKKIKLMRKCMNSFICSTKRPFSFLGTFNEDVNTYTTLGSRGMLFLTTNQIALGQTQTQSSAGGITEVYKKFGTYCKSFQTIIFQPSCAKVSTMGNTTKTHRIHHLIDWKKAVPKIVSFDIKKTL